MALLDALNSQQTGTQTVTSAIDPQLKQAYLDNVSFANTIAARPYEQYGGPRIAGFNADQQAMFQGVRNLAAGPQSFLQGNISQYMNPYNQEVVDVAMRDNERARQLAQQQVNAQAASRGAYGGSRQAIAEAENTRNFMDTQARTAAQLRQQGFESAAQRLNQDITRSNQGLQFLGQTGALQQGQVQKNYDLANQDFQNQFNYPLQQLAIRQSAVSQQLPGLGQSQSQPIYQNTLGNAIGAGLGVTEILKGLNFLGGSSTPNQFSIFG